MNLQAILDYQEIDHELRKIEVEIEKSEDFRTARQARQAFDTSRAAADTSDKKAGELIAYFNKVKKYYDDNLDKINKINETLAHEDIDVDTLDDMFGQLDKLYGMFTKAERELNSMMRKIDEINKSYEDNRKSAGINKRTFTESKAKFDKFRAERDPQINELKAKLAKIAVGIEPEMLEKYSMRRRDKLFPAFVPLAKGGRCGGCFVEQSANLISNLSEKGVIECENCRRIIYSSKD